MPLNTTDVQQILESAIIQAKLAPLDVAPGLAVTLSQAITPQLNDIRGTQTGLISVASVTAPVMSIAEALTVRDVIRQIIDLEVEDEGKALDAAEALLVGDFIDVPKILARARQERPEVPAITGSHAATTVGGLD